MHYLTDTLLGRFLADRGFIDWTPPKPELRSKSMLRSYQCYLADQIVRKKAVLGAAEMSLGKTAATLTAIRDLLDDGIVTRVLIVAPKFVARETWPSEIKEWEHLKDLTFSVVVGDEKARLEALKADVDIYIINRENLPWLWRAVRGRIGWKWDMLVYDESSRLKAWQDRTPTGQFTEFGALAQARMAFERIVELSGTPAPNGLIDLGGQAYILDGGRRLGSDREAYLSRWFEQNKYDRSITPKEFAHDQIMTRMKDVMIGLRSQDYIDLPPQVFNPIYISLPPKIMRQYRDFDKTLVAEDYDIEAVNRGVLVNKLLQFSNGSMYRNIEGTDPPEREIVPVHDLKLDPLDNIIEEAAGSQVLIAYSFKFDLQRIKRRYPKAVIFEDEPNFIKKWNAGKIGIGLAHPASMAHGLNLQYGGNIQVWYGLTWSLELWDQFNRRLARPGQSHRSVFIHVIMSKGTYDQRQYANLQAKGVTQDAITQAVRVRLGQPKR